MIYLTGDIHGHHSITKLGSNNWSEGKTLTKDDYLIILGDFGLLWKPTPDNNEIYWTDWLTDKPWTTLVVPGNHENWERIYALHSVEKFGAPIKKYNDSIFIMERGEIYNIDNKLFFNMGGAFSIDRNDRILNVSWWEQEIPTVKEFEHGFKNLEEVGNQVDYILGHTTSNYAIDRMFTPHWKAEDLTANYFDVIEDKVSFRRFYFGHWHKDIDDRTHRALYHSIVLLGE